MFSSSTVTFAVLLSLLSAGESYTTTTCYTRRSVHLTMSSSNDKKMDSFRNDAVPTSSNGDSKAWTVQALRSLSLLSAVAIPLLSSTKAKAVGSLFELKDQNMVIQDLSFNVVNTEKDADALTTLFQNNIRQLRTSGTNNLNTTVLAFGPDAYISPPSFVPGISTFYEDGGHATITLKAKNLVKDSDIVEIFEKGNGLQFIKVGAEVIRLSKAIEKDTNVKFAYGWVDLETPGGIPMEVIIGLSRDPIMLTCLRVTNVAESVKFCIDELGMSVQPFPLSRAKGSTFEPEQVAGSQYVGYSNSTMGLMLTPSPKLKAPPLVIGTFFEAFTLVYDDAAPAGKLPKAAERARAGTSNTVKSPDGYSFILKSYDAFKKEATNKVEF